jgi:predicted RNA binding protein YcfA (HicA-like mRNA interferase family)
MAKIEKLIARLLSYPKNFTWDELVNILSHFGYYELRGGGSRRKFVNAEKDIISLHKPHPGNILKQYQMKDIINHLKEKGLLKDE